MAPPTRVCKGERQEALMSGLDWRIKYYGIQLLTFLVSLALLSAGVFLSWLMDGSGALWAAAPLAGMSGALGWILAQRYAPHNKKHLSPREWAELQAALEDVPVLSVFHVFTVDRSRLEKFRYIPLLRRYLWECMAEEQVDLSRVVRAAFLLHTFGEDLSEYREGLPLLHDAVVVAWLSDLIAERRQLVRREHMRGQLGEVSRLVREMAEAQGGAGLDDPLMGAAWRLALFGPLARQQLRNALDHREPRVREAVLALLEISRDWPERHQDLVNRIKRDVHPSVQQAAMELLAVEGRKAIPVLQEQLQDPFLQARAEELISDIEAK
jgi:hypothetical protein